MTPPCERGPRASAARTSGGFPGGFTLIEVLVALAILAVALAAAIRAATVAADGTLDLKEKLLATWVAQNRLAEYAARPVWPEVGTRQGGADQGGAGLIAAGVNHPGLGVGGLEAEPQLSVGGAIEGRPHRQQFADAVGPFLGQDPDRLRVGQAVAGGESVGGAAPGPGLLGGGFHASVLPEPSRVFNARPGSRSPPA